MAHPGRRTSRLLALLCVVALGLGATPVQAATATSEGLGTVHEASIRANSLCAEGQMMAGVRVDVVFPHWSAGGEGIVGRLAALCQGGGEARFIGTATDPAQDEVSYCPVNQVVTGIDGREGDLIDAIVVLCQAVDANGTPFGAITRGGEVGGKKFQASRTFGVRWGGSDATAFDVRRRSASTTSGFGSYTRLVSGTDLTAKSVTGMPGRTYCYSARAWNQSEAVSAWTRELCAAVPLDDRALATSGTWKADKAKGYFGGTRRSTTSKGARLVAQNVAHKRIAVLAVQCPGCGTIDVISKGNRVARFNLDRAERKRRYFAVPAFSRVRTGNVAIVVTSASGKRVTIDALGLSRR